MAEAPVKVIVIIAAALLVLAIVSVYFLLFISPKAKEFDAQKIFTAGCISYCKEIEDQAKQEGISRIGIIAVQKGNSLSESTFFQACKALNPDIRFPYQCWYRNCCQFSYYPPI